MKQVEIISAFATIYLPAIQKYHELLAKTKNDSNSHERFASELKASLKWPLKHCGTLIPPKASEKALEIAEKYGVDLFALQWKDQPKAEQLISGERGRNIFVHEHEIPVSILYDELLAAKTMKEVITILSKQSVVWITKTENKKLPQYIREENAYSKAGIKYRINPHKDDWMEEQWKTKL